MPNSPNSTTQTPDTVHRAVRLRLHPGNAETGNKLTGIAGACRYVWNHRLADCEFRYARWKEMHVPALRWADKTFRKRMAPSPSTSFFTLGPRFTALRNDPDHAWLKDYPYAPVRYTAKYLADAYTRYKANPVHEGKPRFKAKHRTVPAFTLPSDVRMDGDRLHIPRVGWLRLAGSHPYAGCKALTVRVRMEGTEKHPKWYAYVCYEVPAEQVKQPAASGALGLDRNVGQATDSDGEVYAMPDTEPMDARIARKQRELSRKQGWGAKDRRPKSNRGRRIGWQLQKLQRKRARKRADAAHQHSRKLADRAHTVVVENLNTKAMTKSAKGTVEAPGKQVKQKSGLNRVIRASGWAGLERKLGYKVGDLRKVNAAYTSQTCSLCSHISKGNRRTQATFQCVACGYKANADHNAAVNILVRAGLPYGPVSARGTGASARRGAFPSGTPTTREQGSSAGPSP